VVVANEDVRLFSFRGAEGRARRGQSGDGAVLIVVLRHVAETAVVNLRFEHHAVPRRQLLLRLDVISRLLQIIVWTVAVLEAIFGVEGVAEISRVAVL